MDVQQLRQLLEDAEELADIRAVGAPWDEAQRLDETPILWNEAERDILE
ncbi:hypothetical protein [Sinomonas gamaensis]|nr:hypothetical protein [Sinomonas gamaensis]